MRSKEFQQNKRKILKEQKYCEKCGRAIGLEVHHKTPLIQGGTDDLENLQVLCDICHGDIHKYSKSELTKIGIEKSRHKKTEPLISRLEFYIKLQAFLDTEDTPPNVKDILDIIDSLPVKKYKDRN